MANHISEKEQEAFLYLIRSALHGKMAEELCLQGIDMKRMFQLGKFHQMGAMMYFPLENAAWFSRTWPELEQQWRTEQNRATCKILMLTAAREELCRYFEEKKIWYMPLKGSILKDMYPQMVMRQMSDQDILIDPKGAQAARNYMVEHGFDVIAYGVSNHDVYLKKPVYNFEIHTQLFGSALDERWEKYYRDVKARLLPDEISGYGYHFRDEDFYIYIMLHAYKHFDGSGTGIRSLMDCYVFLQSHPDLDWDYIRGELEKLGIESFESVCRTAAEKTFGYQDMEKTSATLLDDSEKELLNFLFGAGVYGTMDIRLEKILDKMQQSEGISKNKAKGRYLRQRLFPDGEWMRKNHPTIYKTKIGIPFFYVYRIGRGFLLRRKAILAEFRKVRKK